MPPKKPHYTLTQTAAKRMHEISLYTVENFGLKQCDIYLDALAEGFMMLSLSPTAGKLFDGLPLNLRHHRIQKHVVYYYEITSGIVIVDILHERMDPKLHL